jgi:hypothetical protein
LLHGGVPQASAAKPEIPVVTPGVNPTIVLVSFVVFLLFFSVAAVLNLWSTFRRPKAVAIGEGIPGPDINASVETEVQDAPIAVGLTLDSAELDIATNDPDPNPAFKCKLRVYWTNDGAETIHLGKPLLTGIAIQGTELTYGYELRQNQINWTGDTNEIDVTPGRRCRIWLGLSPALRDNAAKLLDAGELGLLTIPVSTAHWSLDVSIRPRDRGLKQFKVREYNEQKKCIAERFMGMDHGAKEAIRILSLGRVMSAQRVTDQLHKCNFPNADKIFDGLRDDIVPLVARYGNGEFRINPTLEKIVKEVVAADKKEFLGAVSRLPADQFAYKVKNEPGFEARYNAIVPKD